MTWNKNIQTFLGCEASFADAKLVLFGAPFDGTTSFRPGTRFASQAMRTDSYGLETYSPYQDKDLNDLAVFDGGELEFPFGNPQQVLAQIEEAAASVLEKDKIPLMIGGEHLVTLGAIRAAVKKHPALHLIHFDAHTDLREEYLGEQLSHATVLRRCWDLLGDGRIHQFGIRSGEKFEFEFAQAHTHLVKFNLNGLGDTIASLKGKPVYFTLDLDVLDPSVFPGTGTPEPGGISFQELLDAVIQIGGLNIVGCDVNELSPVYDQSGASTAVACKITRELMLAIGLK